MLKRTLLVCALAAWCGSALTAQQITVNGVTDKASYADMATFTIPADVGFSYGAELDGKQVPVGIAVKVDQVQYHELAVSRTNTTTLDITNRLVRFIIYSSARAGTEDGLAPWTPYPNIPSAAGEFSGGTLRLVMPKAFPAGYPVPVVAWVENAQRHALRVNGTLEAAGQPAIRVVRGVGSGFLNGTAGGTISYQPIVGGLTTAREVQIDSGTSWILAGGTLPAGTVWPANARVHILSNLTNTPGSTLTIEAGAVVRVNTGVDFYNSGSIVINGTVDEPVVFMPAVTGQLWGGFVQHANNASLTATGAIFTGSGANQGCWFTGHGCSSSLSGITSHRSEQALISLKGANCNLSLTDCAAIYLGGQFGHSAGGVSGSYRITFNRFLMQRCTTGGEYTDATFNVNDSALIECPDDSPNFADGDNDSIYLINGTHGFTNTLIGWTKDDGVDSGGGGAGLLNFRDCWFESTFHEGNSLSANGKIVTHYGSVFLNCGQAIEDGYDGPTGTLSGCLSTANLVGARFGDNYDWTYNGFLRVTNSIIIYNDRDIWGMNWDDWTYRTNQMDIHSNLLARADAYWPSNEVWNPTVNGPELARFINGVAESAVGVGLALRTNRLDPAALTNGIPVRLSRFSPNVVSVRYGAETETSSLAAGVLEFQPGETVKKFYVAATPEAELLRVSLSQPQNAEITGQAEAFVVSPGTNVAAGVTLISKGDTWHFLDTGIDLGTQWTLPSFTETNWSVANGQFGFGDGDEIGQVKSNRQVTTYFRKTFTVEDPARLKHLTLGLLRDDGGVVYLNGTEVFRSNLPLGPINYLTLATNALPQDELTYFYTNTVASTAVQTGENLAAVEIHQSSATSSDLSFDLVLVGNPLPAPPELKQARMGASLVLYWFEDGRLEEAPNVTGPWTDAFPGNPQTVPLTSVQKFYRLRR